MRTVGIICECNPPHEGHFHLIREAKRAGDARVICAMSGCFVQRGEAAILDPFARAEILVRAGADAVVELPFPFSASGAEFFGRAGVEILDRLGVTELWFGSERGELSSLLRLSEAAESEEFLDAYRKTAAGNAGTARAYFELLAAYAKETEIPSPNDILAISYLRALRARGSEIRPVTVARVGCGYSDAVLREGAFPSATALRGVWSAQGLEAMLPHVPEFTHEILLRETEAGRAPVKSERAASLILGQLRLSDPQALSELAGLSGGLAGRLVRAAEEACDLPSLFSLAATKKYPDATLRRAVLYAIFGIRDADLRAPIAYVRLLAASRAGCAHLAERRHADSLHVITRQGDLPRTKEAEHQASMEMRERALYALLMPNPCTARALLCRPPRILDGQTEK